MTSDDELRLQGIQGRATIPIGGDTPWSDLATACEDRQWLIETILRLDRELKNRKRLIETVLRMERELVEMREYHES